MINYIITFYFVTAAVHFALMVFDSFYENEIMSIVLNDRSHDFKARSDIGMTILISFVQSCFWILFFIHYNYIKIQDMKKQLENMQINSGDKIHKK